MIQKQVPIFLRIKQTTEYWRTPNEIKELFLF